MREGRIERALRSGPPFRPMPLAGMALPDERRPSPAGLRPIAVLLTVVLAVVVVSIGVALYQTTRNIGSPEARITVQDFPFAVSFEEATVQDLRLDVDSVWQKAWSEPSGTGAAQRGVVLAYAAEPEVHECDGATSRVIVRADPVGMLEDLEAVAGFDVGGIELRSVGGRPAATALLNRPGCGEDLHLQPQRGLIGDDNPQVLLLTHPTFLTAVDVDGETVLVQLWAQTDAELARWIDEMGPMLDSMSIEPGSQP